MPAGPGARDLTGVIKVVDARRLSPAAQEVLRLRVVAALESGRVRTRRQAAEVFGVLGRSVGQWRRRYRSGGGRHGVQPR